MVHSRIDAVGGVASLESALRIPQFVRALHSQSQRDPRRAGREDDAKRMPKRSNEFQRLVRVVQKHSAEAGVAVHESAMLQDRDTGRQREVDILITGSVGGTPINTAIECMDRKRKADTPWVEQMWAKHLSLLTTQLLLASRGGFYEPALVKARALSIGTIDYEAGVPEEIGMMLIGQGGEIWIKQPEIEEPTELWLAIQTEKHGIWHKVPPGAVISDVSGASLMAAWELAMPAVDDQLPRIRAESPFTELDVATEHEFSGDVPEDLRPVFLIDETDGRRFEVMAFRARIPITIRSRRVPMKEAQVGGIPTAWGPFSFDEEPKMIVISEPSEPRISIVEDPDAPSDST